MADNFRVRTGDNILIDLRSKDLGGDLHAPFHALADKDGVAVDAANPLSSKPLMTSGGNLTAQTAATGTNWTAFAAQACAQLTIVNDSGTKIEVRQGGAGVAIPVRDGATYTLFGLTNANQIDVRRSDTSNTQVVVHARWEA
jgi:hypothetical protein